MTAPLWRDLTHQQVWQQVHAGPGPYVSDSAAGAWRNAESALRQIDSDLDAAITKAAGWTGAAADATRGGLTPLGGWAVDATGSAGRAAASLTEHQVQVAWVRANLPEPGPAPAIDPPIPLSDAGVDPAVLQNWTVTVGRDAALADQAFHVMDTYATNTALIQQQVPTWTPPPAVTVSVADGPPLNGPAKTSPQGALRTPPATIAPAMAPPIGANGADVAPNGAAAQDHKRPAPPTVSTTTPTASSSPGVGGSASRDSSAPPVPGPLVGRSPGGSGVLPGGPDGTALSPRGGSLDGSTARAGGPQSPRNGGVDGSAARAGSGGLADGVLRGLPRGSETPTGLRQGAPGGHSALPFDHDTSGVGSGGQGLGLPRGGTGLGLPGDQPLSGRSVGVGSGPGGAYLGGRSSDVGLGSPGGRPEPGTGALGGQSGGSAVAEPQSAFGRAAETGRPGAEGSAGYMPMGGAGLGNRGDTHRTPSYLVRTYEFFVDDRRLAGPLITPEDPVPSIT